MSTVLSQPVHYQTLLYEKTVDGDRRITEWEVEDGKQLPDPVVFDIPAQQVMSFSPPVEVKQVFKDEAFEQAMLLKNGYPWVYFADWQNGTLKYVGYSSAGGGQIYTFEPQNCVLE